VIGTVTYATIAAIKVAEELDDLAIQLPNSLGKLVQAIESELYYRPSPLGVRDTNSINQLVEVCAIIAPTTGTTPIVQ